MVILVSSILLIDRPNCLFFSDPFYSLTTGVVESLQRMIGDICFNDYTARCVARVQTWQKEPWSNIHLQLFAVFTCVISSTRPMKDDEL